MKMPQGIVRGAVLTVVLSIWFGGIVAGAQPALKKNTKFPQQILIIRHAEKTGEKGDSLLSKAGTERADALFNLFITAKNRPEPFATPDFIFAAKNEKSSVRPVATVTPLALKLKLPINIKYSSKVPASLSKADDKGKVTDKESMLGLRDELFGDTKYFGKTILVAWRHGTIGELAKTFKAKGVPSKWEDNVFDRVWQINYDDQGAATFLDRPQRLLAGDAEK